MSPVTKHILCLFIWVMGMVVLVLKIFPYAKHCQRTLHLLRPNQNHPVHLNRVLTVIYQAITGYHVTINPSSSLTNLEARSQARRSAWLSGRVSESDVDSSSDDESFDDLMSLRTNRFMDIKDLTYEELLEFAESIRYGEAERLKETISTNLKTRVQLETSSSKDTIKEVCIICLVEYKRWDKISKLDCGHEYHRDCITRWLMEKKICAICKASPDLSTAGAIKRTKYAPLCNH